MLKIIAAFTMLIDPIGAILFPRLLILRIIGRIAFPIFAFMIAEGCKHTRNRSRYFITVFLFGVLFTVAYYVYAKVIEISIFTTFSLSILTIYALYEFKAALYDPISTSKRILLSACVFLTTVIIIFIFNTEFRLEYGFFGYMSPVFAAAFHAPECAPEKHKKFDTLPFSILSFTIGLTILSISLGLVQFWCLLALIPLCFYSGRRGKLNMKYFFYIFYPAHLVIIQIVSMLMRYL